MQGQQNDKYTEMRGQQNDKYTELHGQQNIKNHICSITFFDIRAAYEIMWKYVVEPGRTHMAI